MNHEQVMNQRVHTMSNKEKFILMKKLWGFMNKDNDWSAIFYQKKVINLQQKEGGSLFSEHFLEQFILKINDKIDNIKEHNFVFYKNLLFIILKLYSKLDI